MAGENDVAEITIILGSSMNNLLRACDKSSYIFSVVLEKLVSKATLGDVVDILNNTAKPEVR